MKNSKYSVLKRSQVCARIHAIEQKLLNTKPGFARERDLRAERTELFLVLRERDAELVAKWENSGYPA